MNQGNSLLDIKIAKMEVNDGGGPWGPVLPPCNPMSEVHPTEQGWGQLYWGETSWCGDSDSKTTHGPLGRNEIG